ncbi:MAG: Hsp70 family protein, partial [Alphaproteobacteria bacterium]|nr:Hsp70 family protein [Alphaproteobacteria bacterium]
DKQRRELVEARNHADALVHTTGKNLEKFGDKVSEDEKQAIENAVKDLREAVEGDDTEAIKGKTETLAQAAMKLGEAMYKASQEAEATDAEPTDGGTPPPGEAADPKVVDADFEEVDPDKDEPKKDTKDQ